MKTFEYVALGPEGQEVVGKTSAATEVELDHQLEQQGLTLARAKIVRGEETLRKLKIDRAELINFTTQLATICGAGVRIVQGLDAIGQRLESSAGKELVGRMVVDLRSGKSLSEAMERQSASFPKVYRASVRAGEAAGAMDKVLSRLARYLEWERSMRGMVVQAMIYPVVLCTALFGLVLLLLFFVLPRIMNLFPMGKDDLPALTRAVVNVTDVLRANAVALGSVAVILAGGAAAFLRRPKGRELSSALLLRTPKFGRVARQIATSRFASTAGTLHSAGCDVFTVLQIAGDTCGNSAMAACFERVAARVHHGSPISEALQSEALCDPLLVQMVHIGEETGALDTTLHRLVAFYDEEVPRVVKRLISLLEPAMLAVSGAVVSVLVLAALLPIFHLYQSMG